MTTAHPIRQHVHLVPLGQQVERGLGHADVGLDAHDRDLKRLLLPLELEPHLRDEHTEGRLVVQRRRRGQIQLGAQGSEPRGRLCGGEDGDREGRA